MDRDEERRQQHLGPFELKNRLLQLAAHRGDRLMLNAGRGNPDWVALEPREAFALLQLFALTESRAASSPELPEPVGGMCFGGLPRKPGIANRLHGFLATRDDAASRLLRRGMAHAQGVLGLDADRLVGEWVDGVLGDHYPVPPRMLACSGALVRAHLAELLFGGDPQAAGLDLFAVEGASAGIAYLFQTLMHSGLLARGDAIALGVPIFSPYLEIPRLPECGFEVVEVAQDPANGWRYPVAELDKLRDSRVRLFLAVNPSNPTAVAMESESVAHIARILEDRPDLILVTDDVYAPFVESHRSLAQTAPRNTVLLYSFSKFWGATGLRLGVVGLHTDNVIDARLARAGIDGARRYASLASDPGSLRFLDRMVADSRAVAMNHTAGLSTPQQVQMALFALDALLDTQGLRTRAARELLRTRFGCLYRGAGLEPPSDPRLTHYYATLDIPVIARSRYGPAFADWLVRSFEPIDFVVRLAEERGIVLLDGGGFEAPRMSVRVSLANLQSQACEEVGVGIAGLLADHHAQWRALGAP